MQVKKDDIRNGILTVAERLFIRNGYEKTSLKMLAERCNISKSNIYRYFSSKEEIYELIVGPARREIVKSASYFFSPDLVDKDPEEKCEEVALALAGLLSGFRSELLIVLKSEEGADRRMFEDLIMEGFISACPIKENEPKKTISKMLIFGLTVILSEYSDEESLLIELRELMRYHYLGLNGLKERKGLLRSKTNSKR